MPPPLHYQRLSGADVALWLDALAALRISVFRDFPYLYDGSLDYERQYLRAFADADDSVLVLALHDGEAVGCSTGLPLLQAQEAVQRPFLDHGLDLDGVFYLSESVLLPEYRGAGAGATFFAEREAHAKRFGHSSAAFCAVQRPFDHPRRPADYRPLDSFWMRLGYMRRPDLTTTFAWHDLDEAEESPKPMVFWTKLLV